MKYVKRFLISIVLIGLLLSIWHWYAEKHIESPVVIEKDILEDIVLQPPHIVIAERLPELSYPEHWGPPPNIQLRDYVKLPEPYGYGSSTLAYWIKENQEKDSNPVSFRPPGEPTPTLEESFNIPDTVPNRVLPQRQ